MKAVKYILLGLAPLVLIVGLWMFMSRGDGRVQLPSTITLADVVTGEVTTVDRADVVIVPSRNKRDGKATLYPVHKNDAGQYEIGDRYRDFLKDLAKTEKLRVDMTTFVVQPSGD